MGGMGTWSLRTGNACGVRVVVRAYRVQHVQVGWARLVAVPQLLCAAGPQVGVSRLAQSLVFDGRRPSPPAPTRQVLLKIIQPYTRVRIPFIAQKLNIPAPDVEQLLVTLILDGRVAGHIDQVGSWVEVAVVVVGYDTATTCILRPSGDRVRPCSPAPGRPGRPVCPLQSAWPCLRAIAPTLGGRLVPPARAPPPPSAHYPPCLLVQMNQILEVGSRKEGARRYTALDKWAAQISSLHAAVHNKLAVVG